MASLAYMILLLLLSMILVNVTTVVKAEDNKTKSPTKQNGWGSSSEAYLPQIAPNAAVGLYPGGGARPNPISKSHIAAAPALETPKTQYLLHLQKLEQRQRSLLSKASLAKKRSSYVARQWRKHKYAILKYERDQDQQRLMNRRKAGLARGGKGAATGRVLPRPRPFTPLGVAAPVGPLREEKRLQRLYGKYLDKENDDRQFSPPTNLLGNCWMQAMVGQSFKPSCNQNGTYSPKQCHMKRCWCSDNYGKLVKRSGGPGFYVGIKALTLRC